MRKLKTGLYGMPVFMVLLMALTVYIVFHLAVNAYAARLAGQNLEARFERLDAYYHEGAFEGYYDSGSDFIITVHHVILDGEGQLLYPDPTWDPPEEVELAEAFAARYAGGSLGKKDGQGRTLKVDQNTYYLMCRTYRGEYDGSFVIRGGSERAYPVLAYLDITPVAAIVQVLDHVFILLIAGLSLVTAAILLWTGRRIDHAFRSLEDYIAEAGERRALSRMTALPYTEFNEIADTVFQMSCRIEEAEAAQVKFFQNASHELRTPLTAIRGYAEGLSSGVIRDAKASAAVIMEHSDRMSALVDELLYTSRLDAGTEAVGGELFDLTETLRRCARSVAGAAEEKRLRIELRFQKEELFLPGREEMIGRALTNLLSNAVRYARTEIVVSLSVTDKHAVVAVADDGEGIAPEDLPHIFERFYKGRGGVTGLGLSITQEAVRRHGGTVTASSGEGRTVFTVALPLKTA